LTKIWICSKKKIWDFVR